MCAMGACWFDVQRLGKDPRLEVMAELAPIVEAIMLSNINVFFILNIFLMFIAFFYNGYCEKYNLFFVSL